MKKIIILYVFIISNTQFVFSQIELSIEDKLALMNRPWRDSLDKSDSLFFYKFDNSISSNINEELLLINSIITELGKVENANSSAFKGFAAKKLLDLDTNLGYKTFLDNFLIPNTFWYGIAPKYIMSEAEICHWKEKLIEYLVFSPYLEDKEFYKDPLDINKPISQYSIFFNCDGRKFKILILDAKIASLKDGNKKKNLIAIRNRINE